MLKSRVGSNFFRSTLLKLISFVLFSSKLISSTSIDILSSATLVDSNSFLLISIDSETNSSSMSESEYIFSSISFSKDSSFCLFAIVILLKNVKSEYGVMFQRTAIDKTKMKLIIKTIPIFPI